MVNNLAFAPALDETQTAQHPQVLGYGGLADVGDGRQVAGAQLLVEEAVDDFDPRRVGEGLKRSGQRLVLASRQQVVAPLAHALRVHATHLADVSSRLPPQEY